MSPSTSPLDPALPLCELHRHLDGSIRLETILDLAQQHGLPLPADTIEGLAPYVHIDDSEPGLLAFLERFRYLVEVLVDLDACRRVAYENVEDASREGIDLVELRFSPWFMAERHGLAVPGVVEACIDGVRAGAEDFGVTVGLIGILSRTYGPETCSQELDALLRHRDGLVGMDLAGDEAGFPPVLFREHFERVRDAGLGVTIHAGEAAGPESVWSAIRDLGAQRIGHGFRAVEDPELVAYLADHAIGLECCPTSNLHTSTVASYPDHPIASLAAAGVPFCLNTDDPGISAVTLRHEYEVAGPAVGLNTEQLRASQAFGLALSFVPESDKALLTARCRARAADTAPDRADDA
ncbi:MAG: adenosine deaminase [Xanthomonadales bacterium]|jgi:adenosine deaminase|nr:adenosine deaminase [Xanthomonadales bacterium]